MPIFRPLDPILHGLDHVFVMRSYSWLTLLWTGAGPGGSHERRRVEELLGVDGDLHRRCLDPGSCRDFLRLIPTLKHYSDIVSDMPFGSILIYIIYGIFILASYLTFFRAYTLRFYLTFYLTFYLASILTYSLAYILTFFLASILISFQAFILAFFPAFYLTFSLASGWGLAVPAELWSSRLRSGSALWDLELAVDVRQCPLRAGARSWGPAVPTESWRSGFRSSSAHWDLALAVEVRQCPLIFLELAVAD